MKTVFIPLLFLACLIVSCDPGVQYSRFIKNDSSHELYVIKKNYPVCDTVTLKMGEEYTVSRDQAIGGTRKFEDCHFKNNKSDTFLLRVKNDTSLTINAEVMSTVNWTFSVTKEQKMKGGGACNCRLTITDDLIQ